jgi:hypothetical protein
MNRPMHRLLAALSFGFLPLMVSAAQPRILPPTVELSGPFAVQRLLFVDADGDTVVGDRTSGAAFSSSNPSIASVDVAGVVRAAGDGEAVITATVNGKSAAVRAVVARTKEPFAWSYRNHVIPVLTRVGCNSGSCHGALAGKGGFKLSLRGYDPDTDHFVMTRQAGGRRVNRSEPEQSLVLLKPTRGLSHGGGKRFETDSEEYRRLREWIAAGAAGPQAGEPTLQRIELFPAAATLKPKDKLQVLVRARYSDGHAEDVTKWAKFSSTEEQVAGVDEEGRATVQGPGEAAVTVWYSNFVAPATITVPLANAVDPQVFAAAPRRNFIDELVLKKLAALRIPPSPPCTDREFIRRAFLDCVGALPSAEEVTAFVADPSADKRLGLIDNLFVRQEFVDYWSYKWGDLLLVSSRKLQPPNMWAYYRFVRLAVAENRPWDRFARDIITARGSTLENGAANYFLLHPDVAELTETTSLTFMGMSITCAKCHNHPLEKWTQDQYWAFANLFSRVGLKNGDRANEQFVQTQPVGDAPHLRKGVGMPPAPLDGKPLSLDSPADRREYFADWLTAPENPYFSKALFNRVWRNFLGRGLVEAEDDLRQTNPPTNPELLDALAKDFIAHKYDVKHLIRTIMLSATYQRSSVPVPGNESDDRFYSHYLIRRLPAEVILDTYSQVTGVPTPFDQIRAGGSGAPQAPTNNYPLGTRAQQLPDTQLISRFLDAFGRAQRAQTCSCERTRDASVPQALHLNNGQALNDKLRAKDSLVAKWLSTSMTDAAIVRDLFLRALAREPSADELKTMLTLLAEAQGDRREALEDFAWGVLTGREFLFNR